MGEPPACMTANDPSREPLLESGRMSIQERADRQWLALHRIILDYVSLYPSASRPSLTLLGRCVVDG